MHIVIRPEQLKDYRTAEEVTREAFWNLHGPGCNEHYLLHTMRSAPDFVTELDKVAEQAGKIVGHIAYARCTVAGDDGRKHEVLSFGPLSILPAFQRKGIGSRLVKETLEEAKELGYTAVLIYGDPAFYGRLGFLPAAHFHIATADDNYMLALQAVELAPNALKCIGGGRFLEGSIYSVDEAAAKAFDTTFAPKTLKENLLSQQRFAFLVSQSEPRTK